MPASPAVATARPERSRSVIDAYQGRQIGFPLLVWGRCLELPGRPCGALHAQPDDSWDHRELLRAQ